MSTTFGHPSLSTQPQPELRLRFLSRQHGPQWGHGALTADFIAAYFVCLAPPEARRELSACVRYVVNELMENGIKFSAGERVELSALRRGGAHIFELVNEMPTERAPRFQALVAELSEGDPMELMIARLEANAAGANPSGSGLGFLTIMNDYGAQVSWTFEAIPGRPDTTLVRTAIALPT